jgi:hypothetical protein
MKWIIISLAIVMVLLGFKLCSKPKIERVSMNQPFQSEDVLKEAVLSDGNIEAYTLLRIAYLDYKISEEFLLYAIIMAHKYDYPQAYFDVFIALKNVFWTDLTEIDENTAEMAIKYLINASERGHHQAKGMVEKFDINKKENSKDQILTIYKERLIRQGLIEK